MILRTKLTPLCPPGKPVPAPTFNEPDQKGFIIGPIKL